PHRRADDVPGEILPGRISQPGGEVEQLLRCAGGDPRGGADDRALELRRGLPQPSEGVARRADRRADPEVQRLVLPEPRIWIDRWGAGGRAPQRGQGTRGRQPPFLFLSFAASNTDEPRRFGGPPALGFDAGAATFVVFFVLVVFPRPPFP